MVHFISIEKQQEARLEWISGGFRSADKTASIGDSVCLVCGENRGGGGGEGEGLLCASTQGRA